MDSLNILFLHSGPDLPDISGKIKSKYHYFSEFSSGIIITPVCEKKYLKLKNIGNFQYHPFLYHQGGALKRNLFYIFNIIRFVCFYTQKNKIDIIVSPNPLLSGMLALLIGNYIGAKVVIEVNGNFEAAFTFGWGGG
ncbi:hypothetical protein [Desulfatitalea tepidiphila]|uniref:hypothetical protein n=1 Tax=Desulfatitalea tepidiphila TaxID=1185843 RepID=UPI0006B69F60|nr:hypothetical protein [Desulfatitalea tepidiphila]